jgi:hypothetical protein
VGQLNLGCPPFPHSAQLQFGAGVLHITNPTCCFSSVTTHCNAAVGQLNPECLSSPVLPSFDYGLVSSQSILLAAFPLSLLTVMQVWDSSTLNAFPSPVLPSFDYRLVSSQSILLAAFPLSLLTVMQVWDISTLDAFISPFLPSFGAPPAPPVDQIRADLIKNSFQKASAAKCVCKIKAFQRLYCLLNASFSLFTFCRKK